MQAEIRFEDVAEKSLETHMYNVGKSSRDYQKAHSMVMGAMFTRYDERREYSILRLSRILGQSVEVYSLTEDGEIYTYVRFDGDKKYTYVDTFQEASPVLELVPSDDEMCAWDLEKVLHYSDMKHTSNG